MGGQNNKVMFVFNSVLFFLVGPCSPHLPPFTQYFHEIHGYLGSLTWSPSGLFLLGNSASHRPFLNPLCQIHNLTIQGAKLSGLSSALDIYNNLLWTWVLMTNDGCITPAKFYSQFRKGLVCLRRGSRVRTLTQQGKGETF